MIRCNACPVDHYSLSFGVITLNKTLRDEARLRQTKCHVCPFRDQCKNGAIRSAHNVWGYVTKGGKKVKLHACPSGYCCNRETCSTYVNCSKGRKGILCGSCMEGTTENLVSSHCLQFHLCKNNWYYLLVIIAGIVYVTFFIFVSEIGNLC